MWNRNRPEYEVARLARWILIEAGREIRLARHSAGMRQSDLGRRVGMSKSHISRVEHGRVPSISIPRLARIAAAVGLKPYLKLHLLGRRLLDRPQLELLRRFRQRLHAMWSWETEVPMPMTGDLRSGDCRIRTPGCSVLVEAITRLSDWQAQSAAAARKKRDLRCDRLILLVAATHANRRALAEAAPVLDGSFPMGTRATLSALADGRDPGADAIVLL